MNPVEPHVVRRDDADVFLPCSLLLLVMIGNDRRFVNHKPVTGRIRSHTERAHERVDIRSLMTTGHRCITMRSRAPWDFALGMRGRLGSRHSGRAGGR